MKADPEKRCGGAGWERGPDSECPASCGSGIRLRVTFQPGDDRKVLFSLRNRVVDVVIEVEEAEE